MPKDRPLISLFLDSGAHSAQSSAKEIGLQGYINYIHKNLEWIELYANLDIIGDENKTWQNQKEMERQELKPIPVYHEDENNKILRRYAEQYDYIGIGADVFVSNPTKRYNYFRRKFEVIDEVAKAVGKKRPKIHAFGLGSWDLIRSFPFHSADATTWWKSKDLFPVTVIKMIGEDEYKYYKIKIYLDDNFEITTDIDTFSPGVKDDIYEQLWNHENVAFPALRMHPPLMYYGTEDRRRHFSQLAIFRIHRHLLSYWEIKNIRDKDFLRKYVMGDWPKEGCFLSLSKSRFVSMRNMHAKLIKIIRERLNEKDRLPYQELMAKK